MNDRALFGGLKTLLMTSEGATEGTVEVDGTVSVGGVITFSVFAVIVGAVVADTGVHDC